MEGKARVLRVEANVEVHSQRGPPGSSIVLGTIRHENARVITLVFDGDESNPLGVTPNHPLFSEDRDAWVEAGELEVGEAVATSDGAVARVSAKRERVSPEPVYNLEVQRAKSYYVGSQRLLAHNTGMCPPKNATRFVDDVRVVDRRTGRVFEGTVDLKPTLDRINSGGSFPHRNDGSVFGNREGLLPSRPEGYYREYVHPTPGVQGPGPQRVIQGQGGEFFYTPDHYDSFIPLN